MHLVFPNSMLATVWATVLTAVLAPVLVAGASWAQDSRVTPPPAVDCFCTDRTGTPVELGEIICLTVDGRAYLARCEMSLNNPMWRDIGAECVGARLASGARETPS